MLVHKYQEIDTVGFRQFLAKAVQSFHQNIKRMTQSPEDVMPWKVNGEKWHLGEKGFPPGRVMKWDRAILPRLIALLREVEPKIEIDWANRLSILIRVPGVSRAWSSFWTKKSTGLECKYLGKKGQFNLSQIEAFGVEPRIKAHKTGEILELTFQNDHHLHATQLKDILRQHIMGFREGFGK